MKKEQAFGYGKAKYQREEDFPYELDYNGCHVYRTTYSHTFRSTGRVKYVYDT